MSGPFLFRDSLESAIILIDRVAPSDLVAALAKGTPRTLNCPTQLNPAS